MEFTVVEVENTAWFNHQMTSLKDRMEAFGYTCHAKVHEYKVYLLVEEAPMSTVMHEARLIGIY